MFDRRIFLFLIVLILALQIVDSQSFLHNNPDESGYILTETYREGSYVIQNRVISEEGVAVGNDKYFKIGKNKIRLGPSTGGFYKNKGVIQAGGPPPRVFDNANSFIGLVKGAESTEGDIHIEEVEYKGISDASFVLDENNNIIFADFVSKEGGEYTIKHKTGVLKFKLDKGGRLIFDPESGVIEGDENTEFQLDNGEFEVLQFKGFKAHLDEEGNIDFIEIDKGGRFSGTDAEYGSRSGKFNVYFKEPEKGFENVDGDAIFIEGNKHKFKGRVFMEAYNGISYEGLGSNSLATYNRDIQGSFSILEGDVVMKNEVQEVSIIGGRVKIKRDNIGKLGGSDFDFAYTGRDGQKYEGFIEGGEYTLLAFGEDGKRFVFGKKNLPRVAGETISGGSEFEGEAVKLRSEDELLAELDSLDKQVDLLKDSSDYDSINKLNAKRAGIQTELGDVISQSASNADAPLIYGVEFSSTQQVNFEVDPVSGRVRAYQYLGKRHEIGPNEEFPFVRDSSSPENNPGKLIEALWNNQDLGTLNSYVDGIDRELRALGIDKGSVLYRVSEGAAQEARDYYDQAISYAQSSGQTNLVQDLELKKALTYMSTRDYDTAIQQFETFGEDYSREIRSTAELAKAQSLLARDPFNNHAKVLASIDRSLLSDLDNTATKGFLIGFNDAEFDKYRAALFGEVRKVNEGVGTRHGASQGAWQTTKDTFFLTLDPANTAYDVLLGSEIALQVQESKYNTAQKRFYAVDQAQLLNDKGIDPKEYLESSNQDQFRAIYRANGYDNIIPFSELEDYGANLETQSLNDIIRIVRDNVNQETANRFSDAIYDSASQKVNLADSIRSDPTLYTLFTRGQEINDLRYSGDLQLSEAFQQVKLGDDIELSFAGRSSLNVISALTNPFGAYGVTKALGRGAGSLARYTAVEAATDIAANVAGQINPILGIALGAGGGKLNGEDLSKVAKARQIAIANGYRGVDIDPSDIARIESGRFGVDVFEDGLGEQARIDKAIKILDEGGFGKEADLLRNDLEAQKDLLFAHYSGGRSVDDVNFNPLAKFRQLNREGFSSDSLRLLAHNDNRILGSGTYYDDPPTGGTYVASVEGSAIDETNKAFSNFEADGVNTFIVPDDDFLNVRRTMDDIDYEGGGRYLGTNSYYFGDTEVHLRPQSLVDQANKIKVPVFDGKVILNEKVIEKIGGAGSLDDIVGGVETRSVREGVSIVEIEKRGKDGKVITRYYARKTIDLANTAYEEKLKHLSNDKIADMHINKIQIAKNINPNFGVEGINLRENKYLDVYMEVFNDKYALPKWKGGTWNNAAHWIDDTTFKTGLQYADPKLKKRVGGLLDEISFSSQTSGLGDIHQGNTFFHVIYKDKLIGGELIAVPKSISVRLIDHFDAQQRGDLSFATSWIRENEHLWK